VSDPHSNVLGLVRGALIACEDGEVAVETIKAGDIVNTLSDGPQVVRWVGSGPASSIPPVCFKIGSIAKNTPSQMLFVAQTHRMVLSNWQAELLFGSAEVLVPAKALINGTNIYIAENQTSVTYFHILFDKHEIISANGTASESLYPSAATLSALSTQSRAELHACYPEIKHLNPRTPFALVRPAISAAEAALLA